MAVFKSSNGESYSVKESFLIKSGIIIIDGNELITSGSDGEIIINTNKNNSK